MKDPQATVRQQLGLARETKILRTAFPIVVLLLLQIGGGQRVLTVQNTDASTVQGVDPGVPVSDARHEDKTVAVEYPAKNADSYKSGAEWELVWADEFDGETLDAKNWTRQIMLDPHNEEWQQYFDHEENSYVEDGYLVLKAIRTSDTHGDNQYTSARLHTGGKHSWKYGKMAARIQLAHGKGIWPAFWMLGANISEIGGDTPWPQSGEIDILELWGTRNDGVVEAHVHYEDNGHQLAGKKSFKLEEGIFADNFHVFELEWTEEKLIWYVDGKSYCTVEITPGMEEFHKEFYLLLNIAVGGAETGDPDDSTPFPAQMYVDWVRVYQRK